MIIHNLQEFYSFLSNGKPIIGVDYGDKKLGIAISNLNHTIAIPLKVVDSIKDEEKINKIKSLANSSSACAIVLGLPIMMDGTKSTQTIKVEAFAAKLSDSCLLPVYLQDERFTSKAADSFLKSMGIKRKDRNQMDDKVAASMLLETTLESLIKLPKS